MRGGDGDRLRLARLARGLSQAELAQAAGVSRQAVAGVEAGRWDPSLRVALGLARALSLGVEDLFGVGVPERAVPVRRLAPLGQGVTRAALGQVGGRNVAVPLKGDAAMRAGFLPAAAHLGDEDSAVPLGMGRPTLIVAGCDPALPLLEGPLALSDPPIGLAWWPCGSERALALAAAGLVHVAGAHLRDRGGDAYNGEAARRHLGSVGAEVLHFASWAEGFVFSPGGRQPGDLAGAMEAGTVLINREPGSEARSVLDRERIRLGIKEAELAGYETEAGGHFQVCSIVASGAAGIGVANAGAAGAFGLGFSALVEESYDLVIPRPMLGSVEVTGLLRVLASPGLRSQLVSIEGYDASGCGHELDSF